VTLVVVVVVVGVGATVVVVVVVGGGVIRSPHGVKTVVSVVPGSEPELTV
jgi:hypothetical protein